MSWGDDEGQAGYDRGYNEGYAEGLRAGPAVDTVDPGQAHADGYDAGHADGYAEGRREADITGHLLRPHARRLLELLHRRGICAPCDEVRTVLEDLLP